MSCKDRANLRWSSCRACGAWWICCPPPPTGGNGSSKPPANTFRRSCIREIRTPLLEATELFARGIGEATDVVGKEMYSFSDRGDRSCTLRPEGTASVVRAAIQHGLLSQGAQRLWYGGPMFRYERPQGGRQRQFHQIGIEFLGFADPRSDVEAIAIAWDLLEALGLGGLQLELNSPR